MFSSIRKSIRDIARRLVTDEGGEVLSMEFVLLSVVVVFGVITGLTAIRDSVVSEVSDVAGAVQDLNQSFTMNGISNGSITIPGSSFLDTIDHNDSPEDLIGLADNGILFDIPPVDEDTPFPPPKEFVLSDTGTLRFDNVDTGNEIVTGFVGDGTLETGFTTTTDTGDISGTTGGTEIRFRETPSTAGTFTTTFDDPITEVELWVRDLVGSNNNILGNFTVTLSDGTVLNNAAFTIIPDAISPNSSFGEFQTRGNDRERLVSVNVGGNDFVQDPTVNGAGSQAAGRIVFTDVPVVSGVPDINSVGVTSISFERSGGPNGFQSSFSFSGRVILCD